MHKIKCPGGTSSLAPFLFRYISSFHSQLRAVILWVECGRLIAQAIHSSVTAIQTRSILIDSQSYMHMRSDGPCPLVDYTYYDLALEIPPISRLIEHEV